MKAIRPFLLAVTFLTVFTYALAQTKIDDFFYTENLDPINDSDRSTVWTNAVDASSYKNPQLVWRCFDQRLEVIYSPDEYLGKDQDISVQYRFDGNNASSLQSWGFSTTGTAAFAKELQARIFTLAALKSQKVVMRVLDYSSEAYTYSFSLTGIKTVLAQLACADSLLPSSSIEGSFFVEFSSPLAIPAVYRKIKTVLAPGTYTEELNLVRAEGIEISFSETKNGRSVISLRGANDELRSNIERLFNR